MQRSQESSGLARTIHDLDAPDGVFRSRTANLSVRSALLRFDDPLGSPSSRAAVLNSKCARQTAKTSSAAPISHLLATISRIIRVCHRLRRKEVSGVRRYCEEMATTATSISSLWKRDYSKSLNRGAAAHGSGIRRFESDDRDPFPGKSSGWTNRDVHESSWAG